MAQMVKNPPKMHRTRTGCLVTSGQWLIQLTMSGGSDPAPPRQPRAHEAALPQGLQTALCTQPTAPTPFQGTLSEDPQAAGTPDTEPGC